MFAPSPTLRDSSGAPIGDTSIGSGVGEAVGGIISTIVFTPLLTAVFSGLVLKRLLHTNNGFFTVLLALLLLTLISLPVGASESVNDFFFANKIVWVPALLLYFYVYYYVMLRSAPPPKVQSPAKPWSLN